MNPLLEKYAKLLVNYSLDVQKGERVFIDSYTTAEPLIREVYREVIRAGGHPHVSMKFREHDKIFYTEANDDQLNYVSPLFKKAIEEFECYIHIRAPHNMFETQDVDKAKQRVAQVAKRKVMQTYFKRTATRDLKRNLCQYPTIAGAQNANMSLEDYEKFIFNACYLFHDNPVDKWLEVRKHQQKIVDVLNTRQKVQYKGENIDIEFSTQGRTWINSDGQTNMPSGEVYTSPVEHTVNGKVHFNYPAVFGGHEVEGVTLWVKDGLVEKWEAKKGQKFLDSVLEIEGARRFGEIAIGTNTNIDRFTKNILFDEKIGGTIHMALGQSYLQTGGKNKSAVHWDMITDMTNGGEIYADDELIYKSGQFLFV